LIPFSIYQFCILNNPLNVETIIWRFSDDSGNLRFNGRLLTAGDKLTKELGLSSALWQVLGAIDADLSYLWLKLPLSWD
jgi:hypothetical protein